MERRADGLMNIKNVVQGEYAVSCDDAGRLTTILGSCIAACIYDFDAEIGGMNHFLLPEGQDGVAGNVKYGAYLMELLVNELLKSGAQKSRMKASLFGGSKMNPALGNVGDRNIMFARDYLQNEGIPVEAEDVGGALARRITMHPTIGRVDVRFIQSDFVSTDLEMAPRKRQKPDVQLF
jgi:chemotaxis protein CheD